MSEYIHVSDQFETVEEVEKWLAEVDRLSKQNQNVDTLNHLEVAKKYIAETNGTHPAEFTKAKALSAIAEVLIHIAEHGVGDNNKPGIEFRDA